MAQTQTVVQITKFDAANPTSGLVVTQAPVAQPGAGEVLVNVQLRPVNPADVNSIRGVYPGFQPKSLPAVPGLEAVGVVAANGAGASKFKVGQRVVAFPWGVASGNGTWQQFTVVPEASLVAVPDGVSDEAAAMALVNPVTIIGMFEELKVPAGSWLLITAAGSALSRMAIAYAKHLGVKTIGVVRRKAQVEDVKKEGADAVVCSADEHVAARVKEITGGSGAYAALDSVAGDMTRTCGEAVRVGGTVLVYGSMSAVEIKASLADLMRRSVIVTGFWMVIWSEKIGPAASRAAMEKVMDLYQKQIFKPYTDASHVFPLEKVVEAVSRSVAEARGPKVLLRS